MFSAYGIASGIGPVIGGTLAQNGQWRWLFVRLRSQKIYHVLLILLLSDLNIPICGLAAALVFAFLRLRVPEGAFRDKMSRVDWLYVSIYL